MSQQDSRMPDIRECPFLAECTASVEEAHYNSYCRHVVTPENPLRDQGHANYEYCNAYGPMAGLPRYWKQRKHTQIAAQGARFARKGV